MLKHMDKKEKGMEEKFETRKLPEENNIIPIHKNERSEIVTTKEL